MGTPLGRFAPEEGRNCDGAGKGWLLCPSPKAAPRQPFCMLDWAAQREMVTVRASPHLPGLMMALTCCFTASTGAKYYPSALSVSHFFSINLDLCLLSVCQHLSGVFLSFFVCAPLALILLSLSLFLSPSLFHTHPVLCIRFSHLIALMNFLWSAPIKTLSRTTRVQTV